MVTTARRRGWDSACVLVCAIRTLSQFPSREIATCQDFKQNVSAVLQRNFLEEPFDLVMDVRNPLRLTKFALVNVKTALDVIFENCVTLRMVDDAVHVKWREPLVKEHQLRLHYVNKDKLNCFVLSRIVKITLFERWKRMPCVRESSLRTLWFIVEQLEWIRSFFGSFSGSYIYILQTVYIQSSIIRVTSCYWSIINTFVFTDFEKILLIGIQMFIKEATKKDRLRQV